MAQCKQQDIKMLILVSYKLYLIQDKVTTLYSKQHEYNSEYHHVYSPGCPQSVTSACASIHSQLPLPYRIYVRLKRWCWRKSEMLCACTVNILLEVKHQTILRCFLGPVYISVSLSLACCCSSQCHSGVTFCTSFQLHWKSTRDKLGWNQQFLIP
jgi:hypothetical protein